MTLLFMSWSGAETSREKCEGEGPYACTKFIKVMVPGTFFSSRPPVMPTMY